MKKYLKFISAGLALIGFIMMFFNQVTVEWFSKTKEVLDFHALVGGTYPHNGTQYNGVGSGLAGYILLAAGALLILVTVLVAYFREHDVLSTVVTGAGVICMIVGIILIFLIRKNFADANIAGEATVYVGWAAITAGSCGGLAILAGALGMVFDLAGNN